MARNRLRPARFDDLGLRRALGDRMLPLLVAAMAFLAALALAGVIAVGALAARWQEGAASALTVQVPRPDAIEGGQTRLDRVLAVLHGVPRSHRGPARCRTRNSPTCSAPGSARASARGRERLALPLPAVIAVRIAPATPIRPRSRRRSPPPHPAHSPKAMAAGCERLAVLAGSLQACAWLALGVVAAVAAAVVAIATRAGLAARWEAIETVHGLGATDGYIAGRFAGRATGLAAAGGLLGGLAALPVLLALARLAAPFSAGSSGARVGGARPASPAPAACALVRAAGAAARRGGDRLRHRPGHGAAMARRLP